MYEYKNMGKTKKQAATAKKGRFNILRIYRRNKKLDECRKITRDMRYIDKKYKLGKTTDICGKKGTPKMKGGKPSDLPNAIPVAHVNSVTWMPFPSGDLVCDNTTNFVPKDELDQTYNCYLCDKSLKGHYPLQYLRNTSRAGYGNNIPDPDMVLNGWQHWRASAVINLGCQHMFHYGCLDNYLKRSELTPRDGYQDSLFRSEYEVINCPKCIDDGQDNRCLSLTTNDELIVETFIGNETRISSLGVHDSLGNDVNASEMYQNERYLGPSIVRRNNNNSDNGCVPGGDCVLSGGKGKKTKKKGGNQPHEFHRDPKDWNKNMTEPPGTAERRRMANEILAKIKDEYYVFEKQWQEQTYIFYGNKNSCSFFKERFIEHIRHAIQNVNLIGETNLFPRYIIYEIKDFYETKLQLVENDQRDCRDNNGCVPGGDCVLSGGKKKRTRGIKKKGYKKRKTKKRKKSRKH
jgi:hypothetical protein